MTNDEVKQLVHNAWTSGDPVQLKHLRDRLYANYLRTRDEAMLACVAKIDMRIMSVNGGRPL